MIFFLHMWHDVRVVHGDLNILIVEDDRLLQGSVARALRHSGFLVSTASTAIEGLDLVKRQTFHTVLADYYMPPGPSGVWLLENTMRLAPSTNRVLISGHPVAHEQSLIRMGVAHSFLKKPLSISEIVAKLKDQKKT